MNLVVIAVETGEVIATGTDLVEVAAAASEYPGFSRVEQVEHLGDCYGYMPEHCDACYAEYKLARAGK